MRKIDIANGLHDINLSDITEFIATTEFNKVVQSIGIPLNTPKGRARRVAQISWRTAYNSVKSQYIYFILNSFLFCHLQY